MNSPVDVSDSSPASHREDPQHHGRPSELIEDVAIHVMWLHPIATHPGNMQSQLAVADMRVDVTEA